MLTKVQILPVWQNVQALFDELKIEYPDWYASLRTPANELKRRLTEFVKEIPDE